MNVPAADGAADTIAAVATAPGYGAIGIVRVCGPAAGAIALAVAGVLPPPRQAVLTTFRAADGSALDVGLTLFFPAPHSFTGDDLLELHGHGGPVVLDQLLQSVIAAGARRAAPGEFSERAFLNGKLDLAQAEAIADLISASSAAAARAATRSLQGEFSRRVHALVERLIGLRVRVEAAIDFPDEDIDAPAATAAEMDALLAAIEDALQGARAGARLRDGVGVVIAGRPNVGKSSLLNRLAGQDRAIVSDLPGTTRDLLQAHVLLGGLPVELIDTAGLRADPDAIESEGIRRAEQAIAHADHVLLVTEAGIDDGPVEARIQALLAEGARLTRIRNKIDTCGGAPARRERPGGAELSVSARTGAGVDLIDAELRAGAAAIPDAGTCSARARHVETLERARDIVAAAHQQTLDSAEVIAEHLRLAQLTLAQITGEFTSDDLLGEIFSRFCIGK
ncbi:MAG: tRNA uridine-5-carboxymethylaminomethyl(34) synthesis GTPase MnmE [Gammaproteobacteria bacterium]